MIDAQQIEKLSPLEQEILANIIREQTAAGKSLTYDTLVNLVYEEIPCSTFEFIESKKYLNLGNQVRPRIKYAIHEVDKPETQVAFFLAGKGSGKSTLAEISLARQTHRLNCLKNPHKYYNVMQSTEIACINVSINEKQAKNVIFKSFAHLITHCDWFRGKYDTPGVDELKFPAKKITAYSGHSGSTSFLGYHTITGVLDEADKFVDRNDKSNADELYRTLVGSLRTRWTTRKDWKLIVISSAESETGFMASNIDRLRIGSAPVDISKWPKKHGTEHQD